MGIVFVCDRCGHSTDVQRDGLQQRMSTYLIELGSLLGENSVTAHFDIPWLSSRSYVTLCKSCRKAYDKEQKTKVTQFMNELKGGNHG